MRRILRDHYVGAVLLGLLLYNFVGTVIKALENPVMLWIQRMAQHSALQSGQPWFNKAGVEAALVEAAFYLVVSVLLAWWIYGSDAAPAPAKA